MVYSIDPWDEESGWSRVPRVGIYVWSATFAGAGEPCREKSLPSQTQIRAEVIRQRTTLHRQGNSEKKKNDVGHVTEKLFTADRRDQNGKNYFFCEDSRIQLVHPPACFPRPSRCRRRRKRNSMGQTLLRLPLVFAQRRFFFDERNSPRL